MHAQTTWPDPSPAFGTLSPLRGARGARGECVSRPFAPRKRGEGARSADEGSGHMQRTRDDRLPPRKKSGDRQPLRTVNVREVERIPILRRGANERGADIAPLVSTFSAIRLDPERTHEVGEASLPVRG